MRLVLMPLCLLAAVLAAPASGAPVDHLVSGSDLPSSEQVSTVYPGLAGGRQVNRRVRSITAHAAPDCVGVRPVGRPRDGLYGIYTTTSGRDPYFELGESATPYVYELGSVRAARRSLARLRAYVARCAGRHSADGTWVRVAALEDPALESLGEDALAFRLAERGAFHHRELYVCSRVGRRVVAVVLGGRRTSPSVSHGVAVAALTLSTAT